MTHHSFATLFCGHCGHVIRVPVYCGNRFCPECSKARTGRLRARVRAIVNSLQIQKNDSIKLLTITVPRQKSLADGVNLLVKSFRRLRQRAYFKKRVRGGAYFIEFKHTDEGWNPHLHVLIESAFLPVQILSKHLSSVGAGQICDIRRIPPGAAINYVTKYCTKLDLPKALQYQATEVLRNKRLFTVFGAWGGKKLPVGNSKAVCGDCGTSSWCFNPYSKIDTWMAKQLYVHVPIEKIKIYSEDEKNKQKSLDLVTIPLDISPSGV